MSRSGSSSSSGAPRFPIYDRIGNTKGEIAAKIKVSHGMVNIRKDASSRRRNSRLVVWEKATIKQWAEEEGKRVDM